MGNFFGSLRPASPASGRLRSSWM